MALDVNNNITINWPCDCADQKLVIAEMLSDIELQDELVRDGLKNQIIVFSKTEPSQGRWQTEWINMGNTLPIPNGVECLWYDTTNNAYGAQYFAIDGIVYPVEMHRYRGLSKFSMFTNVDQGQGASLNFTATAANRFTVAGNYHAYDIVTPTEYVGVPFYLEIYIPVYVRNQNMTWTIYEGSSNHYQTLYGGDAAGAFGSLINSANGRLNILQWIHYSPTGASALSVRIAPTAGTNGQVWTNQYPGMGATQSYTYIKTNTAYYGRTSLRFSLGSG